MENLVMSGGVEESETFDAKKLPIMRTLARLHECDVEALHGAIDASELDVHDVLREMVSKDEVEASPRPLSGGRRGERFALTPKGWAEYMKVLGTIYELPE
jgi:DNA-binding MarR family transcriptional regulator